MRTEDDLRTALTSLEEHAPAAARVLPGLSTRRSRSQRGMRSPLALRWVAGIAATAAVAGAVTGVTLTSGTSLKGQNGGVLSPSAATNTTIKAKLLAAFSAASGDIVYTHATSVNYTHATSVNATSGASTTASEGWVYPWQASPGQQVHDRQLTFQSNGAPLFDSEWIYQQPAPAGSAGVKPSATKGETISVNYNTKTWSENATASMPPLEPGSFNVADEVKDPGFKEVGTDTVNGHRAIEFHLVVKDQAVPSNTAQGHLDYLWVDAATYLPLRMTYTLTSNIPSISSETLTTDYQLLPATPANLAKLTPPIPAGFHKVAASAGS